MHRNNAFGWVVVGCRGNTDLCKAGLRVVIKVHGIGSRPEIVHRARKRAVGRSCSELVLHHALSVPAEDCPEAV